MIRASDWRPAGGLTLEPNALRAAVEREHCLVLTAGPGAGKTEMLAQRGDFLLRTGTCRYPKRILAISFKVDACRNLKERIVRRCGTELASRFDSYTFHAFAKRIVDRFRLVLTGEDALDVNYEVSERIERTRSHINFADLIPLAIEILKSSKVARNAIKRTYCDVFLDEFQDCTDSQYELVQLAFKGAGLRLTAVGDTKQKIMGWAGALDGIFEVFAQDFNAVPLSLYRNFRSKPRLLRMQNEIIGVLDPAAVMPDDEIIGGEGELFVWRFDDDIAEASRLAEVIKNWIEMEKIPPSEIAVLVSKQLELYARPLMAALEAQGVPFRNEQQMQDISVEPVARMIVDYLVCLYGEREPKAWIRLVNQVVPFADDEVQSAARKDLDRLIKSKRREVAVSSGLGEPYAGWWESVEELLKKVSIETLASLSPDYESRERLNKILQETKVRIDAFLQQEPNLLKSLEKFSDEQTVRILTIHKSKGLEFNTVVIMAVENEIFFGNQNENRCAFFVGVSRAKERLFLTHADRRSRPAEYTRRWDTLRSPQEEYLGYALPFV